MLERHPHPGALSNDGYPLEGYLWLDVRGRPLHVQVRDLEFREGGERPDA